MNIIGRNQQNQQDVKAGAIGFQRSSTMKEENNLSSPYRLITLKKTESNLSSLFIGKSNSGFQSFLRQQGIDDLNDESCFVEEQSTMTNAYRVFAHLNIQNYEIINAYCEELMTNPYESNLANDIMVGRWLDTILPQLSSDLMPLLQELARFKIDTSVLDIYKNLLILIGKRFELQTKIVVGFSLIKGFR